MTNQEKYESTFIKVFNVDKDRLADFNFETEEIWDSLSHLTLISELEEAFDVMFDTEDILHFGGYENGKKILTKYGVQFDS